MMRSQFQTSSSFSLTKEGFEVITAFDGEEGLVAFNEKNPDLVILDLMLPKN